MTEDFAVLDFMLIPATPAQVAVALEQAWTDMGGAADASASAANEAPVGLLGRLMKRKETEDVVKTPPLLLQTADAMAPPPFGRLDPRSEGLGNHPIRLSSPNAGADEPPLCLVEYQEDLTTTAKLAMAVSKTLSGQEVYYFRYSGSLHPGAHYAFHVYRDGRALRRAVSESSAGSHAEADWVSRDAGMPHSVEADSLPAPEAPPAEIMTPERQGSILVALGIDPEALFDGAEAGSDVIVLSTQDGGAPVSELAPRMQARDDVLVRPPEFSDASGPDAESTQPGSPDQPSIPSVSGSDGAAAVFGIDSSADIPSDPAVWEEEVTGLLLSAVEAGLPEDERVAWLDGFTADLEIGDTEAALSKAEALILGLDAPHLDKAAAAARLRSLYAHLDGAS